MSINSSINKVSSIRVLLFFFLIFLIINYKNRVLASFQTRPHRLVAKQHCTGIEQKLKSFIHAYFVINLRTGVRNKYIHTIMNALPYIKKQWEYLVKFATM